MTPDDLARATPERPVRVGRYDVIGLIRAGGMGTVHDAIDRESGGRVALKTLNHLGASSLLRFKSEFRLVADLSHPNLVKVYELACVEDLWFFTMERIDGTDFMDAVRGGSIRTMPTVEEKKPDPAPTSREGKSVPPVAITPTPPPSVPRLRDLFGQLARGLRALHGAGLLHLDIKPSNVLVDRAGRVVVVDFGLVRAIDGATGVASSSSSSSGSSSISGTPAWMAPEQYAGEGIGEAADWYAVGLLLYLALTGVAAFASASIPVVSYAKRHAAPTPPDRLLPELPPDLSALAVWLLSADPAHRPTGEAIAQMLAAEDDADALGARRARSPLVGREAERARLAGTLARVRDGGTAVVHVVGPSGVGKSALLASLVDDARAGAIALRGRCYERESVPYKAFDGMLDELASRLATVDADAAPARLPAWIGELSRVFPVLATVPAIDDRLEGAAPISSNVPVLEIRRRAAEALRELLASIAARRPLVLAIDDLHWADADSAALLVKLLEAPAPKGLLVAASFRPAEGAASAPLAPYLEAVRAMDPRAIDRVAIDLGPLPPRDAEALARATLAALDVPPDGLAAEIAREAEGVPFYVEELAHDVARRRAAGAKGAVGAALESVLARRVESLDDAERALVEVLAVAESPIPVAVAFAVAGIASGGVRRALWSLRAGQFVRATGSGADDRVELHHDGMREAVLRATPADRAGDRHLALGRALRDREPWLFDAVRHFNSVPARLAEAERRDVAALNLAAGKRARRAAAFPLAFACFRAGAELLAPDAWEADYDLALALHAGAAETAYLSGAWADVDRFVTAVKTHARSLLDQLPAREVEIDARIARHEYDGAVDAAIEALRGLDVDLPARPGEAEVGVELRAAMEALAKVGPSGLAPLPDARDPRVTAAMRIESRISSAAYFARPMLLPVIACRLVVASVAHGLSPATPYALAVYGIVLNTLGMLRDAHAWGRAALDLIPRFDDRSLEARTRHVVHDLVCTWTVPLASTLDDLRAVVAIGKETGDLEYAGYAAHAYVHNAFYASRPLEPLLEDALAFGAFLRAQGQVNALHVHAPFEQVLRCLTGRAADPASLNGDGFDEASALAVARASGSRSAQHIVRLLMGIVRYHFASPEAASEQLELARPFLDGVASTWHQPMFHQYAALAIHALPAAQRSALRGAADASLAALRALAEQGAANFAHRVHLVEAEGARADGDLDRALAACDRALAGGEAGGWTHDVALAHQIAARCRAARGDAAAAARHAEAARAAWARWGARALAERSPRARDFC